MSIGICRSCCRKFRLRKDGRIPWHRANADSKRTLGDHCYGAALKPRAGKPPKPLYVRTGKVIDDIRAVGREHGYAIAVHGSLRSHRDIDLIAVPWTKKAHSALTLRRAIAKIPYLHHDPKQNDGGKPHGRKAWTYLIRYRARGCPAWVDLSVMPRA